MAIKIPGLKFLTGGDAKSRIFIIFATLAAVALVIFLIVRYFSGEGATTGPSRVAGAPSSAQSVPGSVTSPEYGRALALANQQASKQAQISGTSAVPTMINTNQQGFPQQNCTVLCPSDDNANVADDLATLVKQGMAQEDADRLLDLAKRNASVDEFAAALDELVRQGKLTPEQARALLEKYKKQHANALANDSAKFMDGMIKSGQLPLDVANQLLDLQKKGLSPAEYSAELDRLVKEGKLSPEAAAQLLAQYTQQHMQEQAKKGAFALQQMAKSGEITADVASQLSDLQTKNVTCSQYNAELKKLVAAGKMTPAAADKLLAQYRKQRSGGGQAEEFLKSDNPNLRALGERLADLQCNNASMDDYAAELKRAVAAGLISPDMAARLMGEYRAMKTAIAPPGGGIAPGTEAAIPGAEDFAKLQQQVQAGAPQPAAVTAEQFVAPPPPPVVTVPTETAQERQARIDAIQAAMSGQAQQLINGWQTPVMVHREGAGAAEKSKTEGAAAGPPGSTTVQQTTTTTTTAETPALIKAGTILFAVLDTAVNSDYPDTPVMATIVQGPLRGARLLGKLSLAKNVAGALDRVSLNFSLMDTDAWPSAKGVSAFAIDPDTARTVLATNVDYHYFKRFGAIMATSFITGYANAIMTSGSTTTNGIFGPTTTHPELSPSSKFLTGLGQVGTTIGNSIAPWINIPPTVTIRAGVGIGVLFMSEVR